MKGWYIPARPDDLAGDSTPWYASFWGFCADYLHQRFGNEWCLSPEQSIALQVGNRAVPDQLLVRAPKGRNKPTELLYGTSLFDIRASLPPDSNTILMDGLRLFSLEAALVACAPGFFSANPTDARAALSLVRDSSDLLSRLLEGGHTTIAGRLAGAFRNMGRDRVADEIIRTMRAADYDVRESDPFADRIPVTFAVRPASPVVNRIRIMWQEMREPIIERFPAAPGRPNDPEAYLRHVEEIFVADAYHSLSIEGYRVSPQLIRHVRQGDWNPDEDENDREHRNGLAARGYWQAYQVVRDSLERVFTGEIPGQVADHDHPTWYREMFAPSVTAGLLPRADLAGYRNGPVYIRRSMHVPPDHEAVRDAMSAFFELLCEETDPAVRVVLGHFIFVYIHPYMDGNGRIGRFLMNVMLAAGGYPWTIVPLEERETYMAALEDASVRQNIIPFANFLGQLVETGIQGSEKM
ncbi:Fic family protein [Aquisalimonas sp.]|uniref:Fic family protein n=1 Tax=Aquisalimonas sp. TaxID=1872621 RepID=UPI0025C40F59|nr:Fic family protein [Aquisalimonas sp.]